MITTDSLGFIDNLANSLRAVYLDPARMAGFSYLNTDPTIFERGRQGAAFAAATRPLSETGR